MVMFQIKYSKQALKDKANLNSVECAKTKNLIDIIKQNPFQNPPPYEKLLGDLAGKYSRRINKQHRIWYCVDKKSKIVIILRMWSHYE